MAVAVRSAAIYAERATNGIVLRYVHAAVATGHHYLWTCFFWRRLVGFSLLANPPDTAQDDEEQRQVLHTTRPKMTSSTKREPA